MAQGRQEALDKGEGYAKPAATAAPVLFGTLRRLADLRALLEAVTAASSLNV